MIDYKKVNSENAVKPMDMLMVVLGDEINKSLLKIINKAYEQDLAADKVIVMQANIFSNFLIKSFLHLKSTGADLVDVIINFDR